MKATADSAVKNQVRTRGTNPHKEVQQAQYTVRSRPSDRLSLGMGIYSRQPPETPCSGIHTSGHQTNKGSPSTGLQPSTPLITRGYGDVTSAPYSVKLARQTWSQGGEGQIAFGTLFSVHG
ncbi:hypothetical protein ACOMHN_027604 [Nucella lapillus]